MSSNYPWNLTYPKQFRGRLGRVPGLTKDLWQIQIVDTASSEVVHVDSECAYLEFEDAVRDLHYVVVAYRMSLWFYVDAGIRRA